MKLNRIRNMRAARVLSLLGIVACIAAPAMVHAQLTAPSSIPSLGGAGGSTPDKTMTPPSTAEAQIFSSAVDPAEYHLGPGDVLQCRFWSSDQSVYPVVSSDEMLIVPRIGEFSTHGKTLLQLRDAIYEKAAGIFRSFSNENTKRDPANPQAPLSLSLYQPRRIYVKVKGDVLVPSGFPLPASARANVAVDLANKPLTASASPRDPMQERQLKSEREQHQRIESAFGIREIEPASQRYITIAHSDGSRERLDLVRYDATHDPKASPLLREGDVIDVPFRDPTAGVFGVYGAVRGPGEFEYVDGDSLSSAVKYASGPDVQADLEHVELTRAMQDAAPSTTVYDLRAIELGRAPDVMLARGDRVIVRGKREKSHAAVVTVRGEVVLPGTFPIEDGQTHLSDVMKEAGGLTPNAFALGGRVLRHGHTGQIQAGTLDENTRSMRLANITVEDTASMVRQMSMRQTDLAIDLDRLLVKGDKSADITLADGDEILIPERPTTVYVSGFVHFAGFVPFQDGAPLSYYISRAGGYADGAVRSQTVVIKAGTKAWMDPGDTQIGPGDEIYVPKEPDIPVDVKRNELTSLVTMFTSIASFFVTFYVVILKKP